jgi:hypothetical protein
MNPRRLAALAFVLGSAGCGAGAHTRAGGGVGAMSVHEVVWNPTEAAVGHVRAVAEGSGVTVVFADTGATVLASGAVLAVDHSRTDWVDAAVIPGAAGESPWLVGLSGDGHLYRLKDRSRFEDVSARYGMETQNVRRVATLGNGLVGFLLEQQIAIADHDSVTRYDLPGFVDLLGGGGSGLALDSAGAFWFNAVERQTRRYALPGIRHGALDSNGRLYVSTARAIYTAAPSGDLALTYDSQSTGIGELTASRDTVWFTDGRELGIVGSERVAETSTAPTAVDSKLSASANGDVWAISAGTLHRFSRVASTADRTALWGSSIAPIFARVCASCHEPNGAAGIDLSTADAWEGERIEIRERVIEARTMPPQGHELAEADRAAIAAWLQFGL